MINSYGSSSSSNRLKLPHETQQRVLTRIRGWLEEEFMSAGGPAGRKLLEDTFGNSLRYVNKLYRARYGSEQRKAPAHMPHMIDKDIMAELQETYPDEFEATSTHRFRDSEDMQFSFSYFYYLINEKPPFDLDRIFRETLDLNKDGNLDFLEIRHLALLMMPGKPTVHGMRAKMHQILDDLGINPAANRGEGEGGKQTDTTATDESLEIKNRLQGVQINVETIRSSSRIVEELKRQTRKQTKYKHEVMNLNEVEFFMVPDNYEQVQERLDHIMVKQPKFICLNDDMNKTHDPPARTLYALRNFYETYYPVPTPFELPKNQSNAYLHYDELVAYKQKQARDQALGR
mmetsp:Transcript_30/g.65  ORF Transcript_30/g.65 Transcript_30/m.65 type:complete len:345 (-) Transcript_30:119-1153(-)